MQGGGPGRNGGPAPSKEGVGATPPPQQNGRVKNLKLDFQQDQQKRLCTDGGRFNPRGSEGTISAPQEDWLARI